MRPSLLPRLVNGPFEDPALFIRFLFENRAIMFDLGDIHALSTRDILKLTHVFVTHTHMDHFAGFDRLLRIFLGREKQLHLFGPRGFIRNVEGKLGGYQWNLAESFTNRFSIKVTEIRADRLLTMTYRCQNRFQPDFETPAVLPLLVHLLQEPAFSISTVVLDHRIPCLGLSIKEKFHINIKKDALEALGLIPGPWIQVFKQALYEKQPPDTPIEIRSAETSRRYSLGMLSDSIATITSGQKITYVTDILYSPDNLDKIVAFANGSDQFYVEAAFLEADAHIAAQKYHLTTKQAGEIAGLAGAKKIIPFHFSPRYSDDAQRLETEALTAFNRIRNEI
ncbi:MAG: ribonuclease Z [Deltaproteobacteria bacterium]|nr:ribonuclease Z [Deltaproteobacteria bacterium]